MRIVGSLGYRSVAWTQRPKGGPAKQVTRSVLRKARRGSIVSLDLWKKGHRKAIVRIVDGLRKDGFRLATVNALKKVEPIDWTVSLKAGYTGPKVTFLQKTLKRNTYAITAPDGNFGYSTLQAVYAFEKTFRLARDGVVTPSELTKLVLSGRPKAPKKKPKKYVDVDITRQVLFEVRKGKVRHTLPISSGNEATYEQDGQTKRAHTPRGDFIVERKIPGWRTSDLGQLWYPSYFTGGYAIHGSESVPTYPASHGCVRIPMYATKGFYYRNPIGTPVFVHD